MLASRINRILAFNFILLGTMYVCLFPGCALAHATGASWEAKVQSYLVDVGYDTTTFTSGESSRFDFNLLNAESKSQENFVHVWVRVTKDKNTVLATGIWHQPIGPTSLLYAFAEPGDYTIEASFRDAEGNDIAVATFPLTVVASRGATHTFSSLVLLLAFVAGCAIAGFATFLALRRGGK